MHVPSQLEAPQPQGASYFRNPCGDIEATEVRMDDGRVFGPDDPGNLPGVLKRTCLPGQHVGGGLQLGAQILEPVVVLHNVREDPDWLEPVRAAFSSSRS